MESKEIALQIMIQLIQTDPGSMVCTMSGSDANDIDPVKAGEFYEKLLMKVDAAIKACAVPPRMSR